MSQDIHDSEIAKRDALLVKLAMKQKLEDEIASLRKAAKIVGWIEKHKPLIGWDYTHGKAPICTIALLGVNVMYEAATFEQATTNAMKASGEK